MEPRYAVELLKNGADGVIIGACHLGDCHYLEGNEKAVRRFTVFNKFIEEYGINPLRLQFWHISASEGAEFTERIKEYVAELKKIGPNTRKKFAIKKFEKPEEVKIQ